MYTREQARAIYQAGPEAVVDALCDLSQQVEELQAQVKALEDQRAKNSRNSSKPPSTDGFNKPKPKPKSLRPKGKRKSGGQKGHAGQTLEMTDAPDQVVVHRVDRCDGCGGGLCDESPQRVQRRQVFDVPPLRLEVTEHQAETKACPRCGQVNAAAFPPEVKAPVQYGPGVKGMAVYLMGYQLLPYERTQELFRDLFSCELSEGTLVNFTQSCSKRLEEPVERIAEQLTSSAVVHFDETGCYALGARQWLHVASSPTLTYYAIHPKRGSEATDTIGILPDFKGRAIHDCWQPYFQYDCDHGLCNAHHLRELIFLHEQQGQVWAQDMKACLVDMKRAVDEARRFSNALAPEQREELETRYQRIVDAAYAENPLPDPPPVKKKRGRPKKSKARNLLERFDQRREPILAFLYDFDVPFDNNLAERDIRMAKVKQKISGTFRSEAGAHAFCRIRSYISTARKNAVRVFSALRDVFRGAPYGPSSASL